VNLNLKYLRREKTGLLSYYRGVPKDLQSQYGGKRFIVESCKTHDASIAGRLAQTLALRDDERFEVMRSLLNAGTERPFETLGLRPELRPGQLLEISLFYPQYLMWPNLSLNSV
jgi:hypothetical protein